MLPIAILLEKTMFGDRVEVTRPIQKDVQRNSASGVPCSPKSFFWAGMVRNIFEYFDICRRTVLCLCALVNHGARTRSQALGLLDIPHCG